MQKSEVLTTILSDYNKAADRDSATQAAVNDFCAYFQDWLKTNPPIGLGHSFGGGLSIRFADGREFLFFETDNDVPINVPAFSITGNVGGAVRQANVSSTDTSHSISVTGKI